MNEELGMRNGELGNCLKFNYLYIMKKILFFMVAMFAVMAMEAAVVKGKIVDAGGSALDFVNVKLTSKTDNASVYGAISDENGQFAVEGVPAGEYELDITFVGYQTIKRSVAIKSLNEQVALGKLVLREDAKMLGEVEVVGQASQMRFDIDKKVFNVDQNLAASGASASEMLQGIPSVDVDNEGNVSLRNSTSVEVWINGKPSGLTEENRAQILEQMPAGSIEAVEIITNPSAKFNPEGTAGIVRAFIENGLHSKTLPFKGCYVMPMFRYENVQKGRYREFNQIGAELIGSSSYLADVEMIAMADRFLKELELNDIYLTINSIGCPECRAKYQAALKEFIGNNIF